VARNYDSVAKGRRFVVLDARGPAETVARAAIEVVDRRLGPRRR